MFNQLFGKYLVEQNVITEVELDVILTRQEDERLKLGTIAVAQNLMTEQQVKEVNYLQVQQDKRFGVIAVECGYLTEDQVVSLLTMQGNLYMKFLQIFSDMKDISLEEATEYVENFQKYYGFSDDEMVALKENDFDEIVPAFVYVSKPYVPELVALVLRNLVRFVTDDFYIGKVKRTNKFIYKSMVVQRLVGKHDIILAFSGEWDDSGMVALASGFVGSELSEKGKEKDRVFDAIGEFANICNGLLATDLASRDVEVDMVPPVTYLNQEAVGVGYAIPLYIHGKEVKMFIAVDSDIQLGKNPYVFDYKKRAGSVDKGDAKASIVIVDDSIFIRRMLRDMVENMGYVVVGEAVNGKEAVEEYKKHKPDIVTLDITMPVMDGLEALKEIIRYDSKARVVMITVAGQQKKVIQALKIGAEKFVVKPFDEEKVRETLEEMIK